MSIFNDLKEAVTEALEHLEKFPNIGVFILKTKDKSPYCPIYVVPLLYSKNAVISMADLAEKTGQGEVVAVFATIR